MVFFIRWSFLSVILFSFAASANEPVSTGWANDKAIGRHDTTAYHQLQRGERAVEGDAQFVTEWKGAKWYFASAAAQKAFEKNPEQYAPAFNGHCANALSLGEGLIRTSGEHWLVLDDQLYLFFAARGARRWLDGDYRAYLNQANAAWQEILERR